MFRIVVREVVGTYSKLMLFFGRFFPSLASTLNIPELNTKRRVLQHPVGWRRPDIAGSIGSERQPAERDIAIAERLLAAYRASADSGPVEPDDGRKDLWAMHYERESPFVGVLRRGDPRELAAYLLNAARHEVTDGILQGDHIYQRLRRDRMYRRWTALIIRDRLLSLAEAVGALRPKNPETGTLALGAGRDVAGLVEAIERQLGLSITPPAVDGSLMTMESAKGAFTERDLWGIFTAHLVKGTVNGGAASVCEIGGGAGRAAYWARRMGIGSYTIVDLPHANMVQGQYLLQSLEWDDVVFFGEPDWEVAQDRIRVLPAHAVDVPAHTYDVVLNQDSFPEMHPSTVEDYLAWIKRVCDGGLLLSVNHESKASYGYFRQFKRPFRHVSVSEAVESAGGFTRLQRYPYWLRRGYVTELYRVAG
jgi:hypothetical protein